MSNKLNIKVEEIEGLDEYIEKRINEKVNEKIKALFEENDIDIEKLNKIIKTKVYIGFV